MLTITPNEISLQLLHQYLSGAISPRPVCFASTVDSNGNHNLAPFSFFNVFAAKPPIAIFSPNLSGRTGQPKDTHLNIKEVPECVINMVNYDMVHQMSLASSPFEKGVNEFTKAGFTPIPSDLVKPMRVKESPIQLECKVFELKEIGNCNLVMCEIIKIHIDESILNEQNMIDQEKVDLISRMGGNWYCRAHGDALFEIEKPITTIGIGFDNIPENIKASKVLTGNNLGQLGNIEVLPTQEEIKNYHQTIAKSFSNEIEKHQYAQTLLEMNKVKEAWCVLLSQN